MVPDEVELERVMLGIGELDIGKDPVPLKASRFEYAN